MIVFLLLLLVLVAGFVYFYIKNKGVGVDRPLSEGFEIDDTINNLNIGNYYYIILNVWKRGERAPRAFNYDGEAAYYLKTDYSGINNTKIFQRVINEYEKNLVRRARPTWQFDDVYNVLFRVKQSNFSQSVASYAYFQSMGNLVNAQFGTGWSQPGAIDDGVWTVLQGRHTVVDFLTRYGNEYFVYFVVNNNYVPNFPIKGSLINIFDGNGISYGLYDVQITSVSNTPGLCQAVGEQLASKYRSNITINDSSTLEITPAISGLNEIYPGTTQTNKQYLIESCNGTLIKTSHIFDRKCEPECNTTYVEIFSRYGVAFNPQNLSLCDGCNITDDLIGDANATPPVPRLRNLNAYRPSTAVGDVTVSRTLSETGSEYTIILPQNAKYLLGGALVSNNRNTPLRYKIDISVVNGTEEIYTGTIDNVTFLDKGQDRVKISFIDGTGFVTTNNNETYIAETTTYHETTGDKATFTISVYADASYDGYYDFYNNPGNTYSTYSNASLTTMRNTSGVTGFSSGTTSGGIGGITGFISGATGITSGATGITSGATGFTSGATGITSGATGFTSGATGFVSGATGSTSGATGSTSGATGIVQPFTSIIEGLTGPTGSTVGITGPTGMTGITGRVGFMLSTQTSFPIFRGSVGGTLGDMSGNILTLAYSSSSKTDVNATFSIVANNSQPISRALGAGRYAIYARNQNTDYFAGKSRIITLDKPAVRFVIDTRNGYISAYAASGTASVSPILSDLMEKPDPQTFTMEIRDASGRFVYYTSPQPFTIIGNRYPPTTAPSANTLQECFLIQETDASGNDISGAKIEESDISDICANFDGRVATIADLQADLAAGADWCEPGWIKMTPDLNRIAYPLTTSMSKCLPQTTKPITTAGTIVVTQDATVNGVVCYGTKPPNDMVYALSVRNLAGTTTTSRYFKIKPFNNFKKQWNRSSRGTQMEIFAVKGTKPVSQSTDICYALGFVRATKGQLDAVASDKTNTADMVEPGYVADDRVRSFVVINESADNSALSITGTPGVNESPSTTVQTNYCYGTKPSSRTIQDASNNSYTILDYNARRRVWSQYSTQPYKTYNLTIRKAIADEKNAYRKAALIVNDVQTSGVAAMKKPDSGNPYIGCDINAYACKPTAAAERDTAPPQLVSKTKKFKALNEATPIDANDITPAGMQRAINFVLACQGNGGAVPTADGEYPGCEGPCCVPEESEGRLDASMFEEACEKPKSSASTEECDADEDSTGLGLQNFKPFKLSRVPKAPTTGPKKCKSAKLDPSVQKQVSQSLYKDIWDTLKNEKLFSLRMPAQ